MLELFDWLTTTPLGLAATIGGMILLFVLVAVVYELRTRRIYPDRNRRGTKAAARAKAKKSANKAKSKDLEANDTDDEGAKATEDEPEDDEEAKDEDDN